jgi:hypothetical protein
MIDYDDDNESSFFEWILTLIYLVLLFTCIGGVAYFLTIFL